MDYRYIYIISYLILTVFTLTISILKFYDKNSFNKNKIFTIFLTIILSSFIVYSFHYLSIIWIKTMVNAMFSNIEFW